MQKLLIILGSVTLFGATGHSPTTYSGNESRLVIELSNETNQLKECITQLEEENARLRLRCPSDDMYYTETSDLINALIQVESRGNDSAVGDRHLRIPSIGVLQLRPIMVKEVNRILKKQKSSKQYTLLDRWSREKSIEMFMVWKNYHHATSSFEMIARNWNGGPRGYKRNRTLGYWNKVNTELKRIQIIEKL